MANLRILALAALCVCCLTQVEPEASAPSRELSGSSWTPTYFIYLKGPRSWQFRTFVGSSTGSVVSIHQKSSDLCKDGDLDWSFIPPSSLGEVNFMYHKLGVLVFATTGGHVKALSAENGNEQWSHMCPSTVLHTILDVAGAEDGFALVCKTHVEYRTLLGVTRWQSAATNLKAAFTTQDLATICLLSLNNDHTKVLGFNVEDGSTVKSTTAPDEVNTALSSGSYVEVGEHIVFKSGSDLKTFPICGGKTEVTGLTAGATAQLVDVQDSPDHFGIIEAGETTVVKLEPDGTLTFKRTETGAVLGPSYGAVYGEAGKFVTVATPDSGGWHIHIKTPLGVVYRVASTSDTFDTSVHGNIERVLAIQREEGHFRTVVSTDTKRLLALEGPLPSQSLSSKLAWARGTIDTQRAEL